ncbi:Ig-like domain-containing protein [Salinimicrobium sp. GXAS 041]|uniref:Ig-like domain-containing protein n=1 Tax=Salinimicrobium sp. GXAS 041 TaxID=3400806 RepID=UPI003C710874
MKKVFYLALLTISLLGCSKDDDSRDEPINPEPGVDVPVAVDDDLSTAENSDLIIDADDLLDNDTVFEYARITDFDAESEEGGSIEDNRDGTYTYTPPQDYMGEDFFSYTICDNAATRNCSTAQVTIAITAASPVAEDDSYEIKEDNTLTIRSYLDNDQLLDNAEVESIDMEGASGTAVLEENGNITYTPADGFVGEDSFTYTICDDDETPTCVSATITVNVVDEGTPVAANDSVIVSSENTGLVIDDLLENDNPVDDAVITSVNASATAGTVVLNDDGTVTYTPQNGFLGEDSFEYSLCDDDTPNATCVTATVTVTVVDPVSFNIPADLQDYYRNFAFSTNAETNLQYISDLTSDKHTVLLSYTDRHDYLYEADASLENPENVVLMYSGEERYWREYTSGSNDYETQTFNTEHIYPQSRLTSDLAVADLHHLRVADASINSLRLNYPYTDGSGNYGLVGDDEWYPGDEWKGDVARMIMYLNVRYGQSFSKVGSIELFLKWNAEDPVSAFELQRQEVIEAAQGNRNPFIDNPYLATLIWGGDAAENRWE